MSHISLKYRSAVEFYSSRFIRIFTPYYFVLLVVLATSLASGLLFGFWGELEPNQYEDNGTVGIALASLSNVTLFFQDWIMFMKHDYGEGLSFTTNFYASKAPLYLYLLLPQAWTIGLELSFYLLVPWLNRQKSALLLMIVILSAALRIECYEYLGYRNDPWSYRFFPFELALFVLGMLSNRLYSHIATCKTGLRLPAIRTSPEYMAGAALTLFFIYLSTKGTILASHHIGRQYTELCSYFVWALALPVLFITLGKSHHDRYLGELSYPVYLSHHVIVIYAAAIMHHFNIDTKYLAVLSSLVTMSISAAMYKYLIAPLDGKRYGMATAMADKVLNWSAMIRAR